MQTDASAARYSQPLDARVGDAVRGRAIVVDRSRGLCLLCHSGPFPDAPQQGSLAPSLAGAGERLSRAQLRHRLADSRSINPDSIMPSFHRTDHLSQVADALKGRPILDAQEIEDVVEFLASLREPVVIDLIPPGLGP
jgi:sulfur-oxidizing protein SoxX